MVITYHGKECFKVSLGSTTIALNPISKDSKEKAVKFGADIALVSLHHPDMNGVESVTYGDKEPFVIHGPGEYEVGEVTVRGFGVPTTYQGEKKINTIYKVTLEGMTLVFLGALGNENLDASIREALGEIDILFVPIGGGDLLGVVQASALGVKLEARLVIPMDYDEKSLKAFLKEEGVETKKAEEKLTIKKKDVLLMEGEIAVLKS